MRLNNLFFYSNRCTFSKTLMEAINSKNLTDFFVFVCVDNPQYKLPKFVDRTPLLYTTNQNIIVDDALESLILNMGNNTVDPRASNRQQEQNEVEALELMNPEGISDAFSFVTDDDSGVQNKNYIFITSYDSKPSPQDQIPQTNTQQSKQKFDEKLFDEYKNQRANDIYVRQIKT